MQRLDRYVIAQLLGAMGFFSLIFTGVIWLTQSIRLIDTVISSGETAAVFAEFSVLLLPRVLAMVLPLSALSSALFVLNRLYTESELVVMMTSGLSPVSLARPVAIFGLMVAALTLFVTVWLSPIGTARLEERRIDIRSELANAILVEGQFLNPAPGLTLYIRDTAAAGEMAGIFLHDQRDKMHPVTYSAERALFFRDATHARILMADGVALTFNTETRALSQVRFDEFVFDLSDLLVLPVDREKKPAEYGMAALLSPTAEMLDGQRYKRGDFIAEAHDRIAAGLQALALPLIALAALMTGGYRRHGFRDRVFAGIAAAVVTVSLGIAAKSVVAATAALWPLAYLPSGGAIALSMLMLLRAGVTRRRPTPQGVTP